MREPRGTSIISPPRSWTCVRPPRQKDVPFALCPMLLPDDIASPSLLASRPSAESATKFFTVCHRLLIAFFASSTQFLTVLNAATPFSLTVSQFLYRDTPIAMAAVIASVKGPPRIPTIALMALTTSPPEETTRVRMLTKLITDEKPLPNAITRPPRMVIRGPMPPTTSATVASMRFCPSSRPVTQFPARCNNPENTSSAGDAPSMIAVANCPAVPLRLFHVVCSVSIGPFIA